VGALSRKNEKTTETKRDQIFNKKDFAQAKIVLEGQKRRLSRTAMNMEDKKSR